MEHADLAALEDMIARLARISDPALLLGPRGTGKTKLARRIHEASGRPGEFIRVTPAGLPDDMAYGLMAGHAQGAFTGAHTARAGRIEAAHRGTLFIDEIGDASPLVQVLLLDVIEDQRLCRLGEDRARAVDVRVIAATSKDVDAPTFRADLRDRFGYFVLQLPLLTERRNDIVSLARKFIRDVAIELGMSGEMKCDPDVEAMIMEAPWPGNLRQLRALCRFAVVKACPGDRIELRHLPRPFIVEASARPVLSETIDAALKATGGNKAAAARMLDCSRTTIHRHAARHPRHRNSA